MVASRGNDLTLGQVLGRHESFVLPADARDKHLYVAGATGTGKSKFLESLVRQDIARWSRSGCGLLLLDPHGSLYDSLIRWLAWHPHLRDRPIIPIDLRQDTWIPSYNVLRQRKANPSVVVETFVDAMAYTWGVRGTDQTPLFARWASNTLRALYEKRLSLAEATHLMDRQNQQLRHQLTGNLNDDLCERDWAFANQLSPKDFDVQIGSTLNRLSRFLRNEYMRNMFGQVDVSLDLGRALEEGAIILVSLAREGGRVSKEDADLFATLLLSDLWTAAQERGKRSDLKPFYVYVDEAQRFVTPTIAENLDEARGFGLHVTLANQFLAQFLSRGEAGRQLYDSVMENATTKVVFRLTSEDSLQPMAQWLFRGTMNPDEVKLKLNSTKVMSHRIEIQESHSRSTSKSRGGGRFAGSSSTNADGASESLDPETWQTIGQQNASSQSYSSASGESASWSESESESTSYSPMLIPVMGEELTHVQFRSLEEQLFRAMSVLFAQSQRHCVVRIADRMQAPISLEIPMVQDPPTTSVMVQNFLDTQFARWPFMMPMDEARDHVELRAQELLQQLAGAPEDEPATSRRRVRSPEQIDLDNQPG